MSANQLPNEATASGVSDAQLGPRRQPSCEKSTMWSAKGITTVGTINVTTLNKPGKLKCVIHEINRYNWDILGVAETHWPGEGEILTDGIQVLYSGREDNTRREGVALLLGKRAQRALLEHKAINSRLISATFRGHHKNFKLIQVYAPDSTHDDDEVEDFYSQLEDELQTTRNGEVVLIMGDFNSKIGNDPNGYTDIMGKFGLGEQNERGERLLEFCQHNQMSITNTYFYHRKQRRHTWNHPDGTHKNCIDYILVSRRWRSSIQGTKVMRGADFDTTHELLLTNVKIKFKTEKEPQTQITKYNLDKLKTEEVKTELKARIGGRFEPLLHSEEEPEVLWSRGRDIIKEEAENLLGKKRKLKQIWMNEDVLQACDLRREAKRRKNANPSQENKETYRQKSREVERKCKEAKTKWMEDQCKLCEDSFQRGNSKKLYDTIKLITSDSKASTNAVRDQNGEKVTAKDKVQEIWKNHFRNVLSGRQDIPNETDYPELMTQEPNNDRTPHITTTEVNKAISLLATGKAPGIDGIPGELLKAGGTTIEKWLKNTCQGTLEGKESPNDWKTAEIIPIHKKGDTTKTENYRPISKLPHAYKVFANILRDRIKIKEEEALSEEQAGFRPGRGTIDHIFTFNQIVERCWEFQKDIYCVFIDFKQAFDSVWRNGMLKSLEKWNIDPDIIEAINNIYSNTTARVKKGPITTDNFTTTGGVIQGCPLSPHLFNLFLEWVLRTALEENEGGIILGGIRITNLRYADDIVILAETKEDLQRMLGRLEDQCQRYGLVINREKTKSMKIGRHEEDLNIRLSGGEVEQVKDFKYLGVYFTSKGGTEKAVKERIAMGQRAFGRLKKIWQDRNITTKLKIKLLRSIVIPTVLYGAECWVLRKEDETKLLALENKCLRKICRVRWQDRVTNERVREIAGLSDTILDRVRDAQRRWFGHVQRMDPNRWPHVALNGRVHGSRPRGRPRDTWLKRFRLSNQDLSVRQLTDMARNRKEWLRWRHHPWDPTWRPPDGT